MVFVAAASPSLLNAAIAVTSFAVEPGCVACVKPISVLTFQPGNLLISFSGRLNRSQSFTGGKGQQADAITSPVLSSITTTETLFVFTVSSCCKASSILVCNAASTDRV